MNGICQFKLCTLSDGELLKKVDELTDDLFETQKVPSRHVPARPNDDYDLLVGELVNRFHEKAIAVPTTAPAESETGIWLQSKIKYLSRVEGELVRVSDYASGLSLKFANGNSYTLSISKQCQVTLD